MLLSEPEPVVERKYHEAVKHVLREGEPFFLIRAQDQFSVAAVQGYCQGLLAEAHQRADRGDFETAAHLRRQVDEIAALAHEMAEWQEANADLVKIPD